MKDPTIGRALFLKVRGAYLRTVLNEYGSDWAGRGPDASEAIDSAIRAVNIHDPGQALLIGMTPPSFDDGTVTRDIVSIVGALTGEQRGKVLGALLAGRPGSISAAHRVVADVRDYLDQMNRTGSGSVGAIERSLADLDAIGEARE